jgi:hypothetical protein
VKYSARLGPSAKLTTAVVFVILASVSWLFISLPIEHVGMRVFMWVMALIPAGIFIMTYLYSPLAYELTDDALIVRRLMRDVIISYKDILTVDFFNDSFVRDLERTGGNGGVFGFYGEFSAGNDIYHLYVTRIKGTVLVTTRSAGRIIISPEDKSLVHRLRERIHRDNQVSRFSN